MEYIFDIECNGLLETVTKIHSLVIRDATSGELVGSYFDDGLVSTIKEGLEQLNKASVILGHNVDGYDLPALKKVLNWEPESHIVIRDTLVMSRLGYPNLFEREISKTQEELGYKQGSHSLEAWGVRLGELKSKIGEEDEAIEKTFEKWTPEMQEYCVQDTKVNYVLYQKLLSLELSSKALEIEHKFNRIIQEQMKNGIAFNSEKAKALAEELQKEVNKIEKWSVENIQPKIVKLKTKDKIVPFNIGSTDQVADYFKLKYDWNPKSFTPTQKPKVDGEVLSSLPYPEAKIFRDYHDRTKILGFLTEGKNSWLKAVKEDGRIYGYVNSNGQLAGRVTMSKPNLGQIPKEGVFRGKDCRSLFIPRAGYSLVDCDASGIQLRMLGHYLFKYDQGEYAKEIVEGDIHTKNMLAAGLQTRPQAKEFIYAFLFGAGQAKLGSIALPESTEEVQRAEGKRLKTNFLASIPVLNDLLWDCKRAFNDRGYIRSIDGRTLYPRGDYKTLNTLLQGGEAVVMKLACNLANDRLKKENVKYHQVGFIHDEVLLEVEKGAEQIAGEIVKQSIRDAGIELKLNIPLDGEYQIGINWAEVH